MEMYPTDLCCLLLLVSSLATARSCPYPPPQALMATIVEYMSSLGAGEDSISQFWRILLCILWMLPIVGSLHTILPWQLVGLWPHEKVGMDWGFYDLPWELQPRVFISADCHVNLFLTFPISYFSNLEGRNITWWSPNFNDCYVWSGGSHHCHPFFCVRQILLYQDEVVELIMYHD